MSLKSVFQQLIPSMPSIEYVGYVRQERTYMCHSKLFVQRLFRYRFYIITICELLQLVYWSMPEIPAVVGLVTEWYRQ